ncbi:hypothetical protein Cni_G21664 [Canna indica]|uniref:Uncharacterized protein n=1 Tax=Canna indica TaxID=4628 RepID=A0AAQ3KVD0_9LILI|nr:hypothetical protein Cni_G21664 [Canna indica]
MPPNEGRGGDVCIWLITFLFFLVLLAGGAFLVLYIALPESKETAWFPVVGMFLVAVPWAFWILTCFYRLLTTRGGGGGRTPSAKGAAVLGNAGSSKTGTGSAGGNSPVESPGGARKVRFANATAQNDAAGSPRGAGGTPTGAEGGDGGEPGTARDGGSINPHESEVPLALSM